WNGATKLADTSSTIVVKTAGAFTVTATNNAGCSVTSSATAVTVTPSPHPVIAGPESLCVNGTGSYSIASVPGSIQWQIQPATLGSITSGQGTNQIAVQ